MADAHVTLRYGGGGSLTFADASGARHRVLKGAAFSTDARTAAMLLRDPSVTRADQPAEPAPGPTLVVVPDEPAEITVAQLRTRAEALGLSVPARARKADLVAAIATAEMAPEPAAEPDEGGTSTPADDPDATSSEEAGTPPDIDEEGDPIPPPAPSTAGTITLADLPPGARRPPSQGGP